MHDTLQKLVMWHKKWSPFSSAPTMRVSTINFNDVAIINFYSSEAL